MSADPLAEYVSKKVIVDTDASIVYLGVLAEISETAIVLTDTDVHGMRDTSATREVYIMETAKYGVRANRKKVTLMRSRVLSVSLLDDIVKY